MAEDANPLIIYFVFVLRNAFYMGGSSWQKIPRARVFEDERLKLWGILGDPLGHI